MLLFACTYFCHSHKMLRAVFKYQPNTKAIRCSGLTKLRLRYNSRNMNADCGSSESQVAGKCAEAAHKTTTKNGSATLQKLRSHAQENVAAVLPSKTHTVLHEYPIAVDSDEPPLPHKAASCWDAHHVRLPCAPESKYPVTNDDGSSRVESRWDMIEEALLQPINNSQELQTAILKYNTKYDGDWHFGTLHKFFNDELDASETRVFFEDLLPRIVRLALSLPQLVMAPIPLLKQNQNHSLTMSQQQISCLLANAFLCTFPRRNTLKRKSEYSSFPEINFIRLYQSKRPAVFEKLKCILHYFRRVCPTERDASNVPNGCVTFIRRSVKPEDLPDWSFMSMSLGHIPLHISSNGTIEDDGDGLLQVDFANKYLGGGVLGSGCVQEEIRFVICPELLASKLVTECLRPHEALLMIGSERFSNYTGYADSFAWSGNHEDNTPWDASRRRLTAIVAIDALSFQKPQEQFRQELILRELNKAYVGFMHPLATAPPGVATGNWGCGAFGGDIELKSLIQLMVCAVHHRPLVYFTFGNEKLRNDFYEMYQLFKSHCISVRTLYAMLRRYKYSSQSIYQFIRAEIEERTEFAGRNRTNNETKSVAAIKQHQSIEDLLDSDSVDEYQTFDIASDNEDEMETNEMLLAATLKAEAAINKGCATADGAGASSSSSFAGRSVSPAPAGASKATRQMTLNEMLDSHYLTESANGSKRQRQLKEDIGKHESNPGNPAGK